MFPRATFSGIGFLFRLVYLGLFIYFFVLATRATTALEKIASALESKTQQEEAKH